MIITRTPFRISFFGGGTDYPQWYREHGGAVLSTSIDKYCYISCRNLPPFFEHKHRIVYSKIENVVHVDDIEHPSVRAVFQWLQVSDGIEVHHDGDLPARSGLGSSSAFTVGLIHALRALRGQQSSKSELASGALHVEQNLIGENVGSQDQVVVAYGGLNRIDFPVSGDFSVQPVVMLRDKQELLNDHMMLFFTGITRIASDVAASKIQNLSSRSAELNAMRAMVDEALNILTSENVDMTAFGRLLHESWLLKRRLSDAVSTLHIDQTYEVAMRAGAIGGKLLGAGGGGFLLIFAEPEKHAEIRKALAKLIYVPFRFEASGSNLALYQPQGF
jgi:D-glycero-alpha-D-manno-heptose-7-phosphate kinase